MVERAAIDGGLRLTLDAVTSVGDLAELVVAEHACCPFLSFAITIDDRGRALEVTAPPGAGEAVTTLFG